MLDGFDFPLGHRPLCDEVQAVIEEITGGGWTIGR